MTTRCVSAGVPRLRFGLRRPWYPRNWGWLTTASSNTLRPIHDDCRLFQPFLLWRRKLMSAVRLRFLGLLVLAAFYLQPSSAAEPRKVATVEGITEYQLDNGLRVLLFPDGSRPTVTVNMTVLVGSRHEGYGEAGMAHLLEHMLFKGTPTYPDGWKILRERGASANGSTWFDRTNYYETFPAGNDSLEFAIRFEADRLMNCFVRREDLLSEMT